MFNWKAEIEGDRIRFLREEYPLGHFCLELLQHARIHDAAARVSVLWDYLDQHLRELQNGLILQKQIKEIHGTAEPAEKDKSRRCLRLSGGQRRRMGRDRV